MPDFRPFRYVRGPGGWRLSAGIIRVVLPYDAGKFGALVAAVGGGFGAGGAAFAVCTEYAGGGMAAAQFGQGGGIGLAGAMAGEAFVDMADAGFGADFAFGNIRAGGHEALDGDEIVNGGAALFGYGLGSGGGRAEGGEQEDDFEAGFHVFFPCVAVMIRRGGRALPTAVSGSPKRALGEKLRRRLPRLMYRGFFKLQGEHVLVVAVAVASVKLLGHFLGGGERVFVIGDAAH